MWMCSLVHLILLSFSLAHYFLTFFLNEYIPINLVGTVLNKVVLKVLANCLKKVLGSVISKFQRCFLREGHSRWASSGDELIAWNNKANYNAFFLNHRFRKCLWSQCELEVSNLNFGSDGFSSVWCTRIDGILSSDRLLVLVDRSPTFELQCYKGMNKGSIIPFFISCSNWSFIHNG